MQNKYVVTLCGAFSFLATAFVLQHQNILKHFWHALQIVLSLKKKLVYTAYYYTRLIAGTASTRMLDHSRFSAARDDGNGGKMYHDLQQNIKLVFFTCRMPPVVQPIVSTQ